MSTAKPFSQASAHITYRLLFERENLPILGVYFRPAKPQSPLRRPPRPQLWHNISLAGKLHRGF